MSQPNIFKYATSELSQDAFLCWLLSWADPSHSSNASLHSIAKNLIDEFFRRSEQRRPDKYTSIEVKKQTDRIDILLIVNRTIPILIEDKTFTDHHSNQLARYRQIVKEKYKEVENFPAIYLKTGDQSAHRDREVKDAGYTLFSRKNLLDLLYNGKEGVDSDIFLNYLEYLESIEKPTSEYRDTPLEKWEWQSWTGFYLELQTELSDGDWGYVPNPNGGFLGFWWHARDNKYLQLEQQKLAFKIEVSDTEQQAVLRQAWYENLMQASQESGFLAVRPTRFGKGTWMTFANYGEKDYRQPDSRGCIDFKKTLEVLKSAEQLLDSAIQKSLLVK